MIVALYPHPVLLPFFFHCSTNPQEVFEPEAYAERLIPLWPPELEIPAERLVRFKEHKGFWNLLNGLYDIDADDLLAHVGFALYTRKTQVVVEISTIPDQWNRKGLPVLVGEDGDLGIQRVWTDEDAPRHSSPYRLIPQSDWGIVDVGYWRRFFSAKIREAQSEFACHAEKHANEAQRFRKMRDLLASQPLI